MSTPAIVVALIVFWYFITPLRVWQSLRANVAKPMEPFDPSRHKASPAFSAFLEDGAPVLIGQQFHQVADLIRQARMTTMRVGLFVHPDGVMATIVEVSGRSGAVTWMVEFTAKLSSGAVLDVNNSRSVPIFAAVPEHPVYRFPEIRDPVRLYRIFRALLERRYSSATVVPRDVEPDPAAFLTRATDAEYQRQVATGYYRFDEAAGRFVPTLKGAYLMTWKMLFPFKQIRKAMFASEARRLLSELEVGSDASWREPAQRT